jgi:hypothetical protein
MAKWTKQRVQLPANHNWRGRPGNKLFVANRGDVRFEFPEDWIVKPGPDSIRFWDREPPDDDCLLQISVIPLPPGIDWSGLPLTEMLDAATRDDERGLERCSEVQTIKRQKLEAAWVESRFTDPIEQREARNRTCLARGGNVQTLITMEIWPEDLERFGPVWDEVLATLKLDQKVDLAGRPVIRPSGMVKPKRR